MDDESPPSLTNISLAWLCHNVEVLCVEQDNGSLQLRHCPLFPQELADQLLHRMAHEGVLNDRTVSIFQNLEHLRLRRAHIQSSHLSAEAFRLALCPHKLQELNASHIHSDLTISDILHSITSSKACRQGLQTLLMNGLHLYGEAGEGSLQASFSMLRGLKKLSLAWTDLEDRGLEDICAMAMLESLDISGTNVTDLRPLLNCESRLRSLTVHGLQKLEMPTSSLILVLSKLQLLRHLDISNDKLVMDGDNLVQQLLERPEILLHLVSLDVSGWRGLSDATVQAFLEVRPGMRFIGLLATGAGGSELLCGDGDLKVAGESNLTQLCEALRRYSDRESFMLEILKHLYSHTNNLERPQPNIIKLVLAGMKHHTDSLHVQLVATACVFNLTVQEMVLGMSLHLVGTVVQQLLTAMKNFPNHEQLQKNCLLTLCSDHILQVVPFDRYEAAKLIMMLLGNHGDQTVQRMAVAVVSVLVSKLSTEEISELGAEAFIMKQLLSIVQQKASLGVVDSTLKFALSALWNLTDETPTACLHFIQCQGLELYMELLESYYSEFSIQQKLLGLLNNVAEVEELRTELMDEDLVEHILSLLINPEVEVDVRYFAGGILAHLTSVRGPEWRLDAELHCTVQEKLHSSILSWSSPEHAMVSYRTLQPFYPLLHISQCSGVQLWALWAIQFVCSQNAPQYCSMLQTEGGTDRLRVLSTHPDTHSDVKCLVENIFKILERNLHSASPGSKCTTISLQ
ncbi:protein zyg-11 homolog isoform X1 [Pimephales promelas]|uniref:protein zyg-11 homolog isoform X1 n=1 Tax=Pimephales promelas TaxID=90988 RepID=UPI001955B1D4|nr:protein zyg-11 homolog isoform X1 [Pimephales promelas]KAG1933660.1 protein zyg-11 B [Pimephales promelas]